jgi:hypothetical protein
MQPQTQVVVDMTPEPKDYYRLFDYTWGNLYRWVFAALAVLLAFNAWKLWPSQDSNVMLCIIAALVAIFLWPWLRIRYQFRAYPAFRKQRRFTFDCEGVHFQSEDVRGDYKWSAFASIVETPRHFLFKQTRRSGTTIPKRYLSESDIEILRKLLRDNFRGKRRIRID